MKILHIIPSLMAGGAERLVIDICNELNKINGVEVKLILLSDQIDFDKKTIEFNFLIIKSNLSLSIKGSNQVDLSEFERRVMEFEPDIIHSHLFEAELLSRWKIFPKIRYVTHCHDNMSQMSFSIKKGYKKNITDYYERQLLFNRYKECDNNFIAISKDTNDYFFKVLPKVLKKNVFLLPNSIDFKRFYFENRAESNSDNEIRAVSVGSLVNKKNQAFLIPIVSYLKNNGYDCKIDVLGDGPNRESLQTLIDANNLHEEIILHGNVKNVEEFMRNAEFYIHTATYEPFGLVLLEAMAAGLPVISLDGKGNRDIINHNQNGFIFTEQDPKSFGDIILKLKKDKEKYLEIVEAGQKSALAYDITPYVTLLTALYREILHPIE